MNASKSPAAGVVARPVCSRLAGTLGVAAVAAILASCCVRAATASESPVLAAGEALAQAARSLRAAESRSDDETTRALYRKAGDMAERALQENPNSAQANFIVFAARGRILLAEGPLKNLLKLSSIDGYLDRALELDPDYAHALAAKGGMLLDLPVYFGGDPKQAEQILRHAVNLNPTGPGTRLGLAKAMLRNGDSSGARLQLLRAGHYACVERRAKTLREVRALLAEIDAPQARVDVP